MNFILRNFIIIIIISQLESIDIFSAMYDIVFRKIATASNVFLIFYYFNLFFDSFYVEEASNVIICIINRTT